MVKSQFKFNENKWKLLGQGAYGIVYPGIFENEEVAIKRIEKLKLGSMSFDREEDSMRDLEHPNVLKLLHVDQDDNFKYIILELCQGTVYDYIQGIYTGQMPEPSPTASLFQMAAGLEYIHSKNMVHRDIKAVNVLIKQCGDDVLLKISDFGFCKPASERGSFSMSKGKVGTRNNIAPELLTLMEQDEDDIVDGVECNRKKRGTVACDVFSLGCLFFNFLTKGAHPFTNRKSSFLIDSHILKGKYDLSELPHEHSFARVMIEKMIQLKPGDRPKMEEVVAAFRC